MKIYRVSDIMEQPLRTHSCLANRTAFISLHLTELNVTGICTDSGLQIVQKGMRLITQVSAVNTPYTLA